LRSAAGASRVTQSLQVVVWRRFQQAFGAELAACAVCAVGRSNYAKWRSPIAQGGTHALSNLQPAHGECNRRKGAGRRRSTVLRPAMTATPMRAASPSQLLPYPRAEQDTLTVRQVAALLRFDPETVRRWLRKGLLRGAAGPKGAGYRIARSELERVLAEHSLQAAPEACVA